MSVPKETGVIFHKEMGAGPPVVILHGLLGSLNNWQSVARELSGSYRVFLLDQRNHGRSFHSPLHSYRLLAEDLHSFLADQNLDQIRLIGHSMGGKAAMTYTLLFPNEVARLVVVDIAARAYSSSQDKILDILGTLNTNAVPSRDVADRQLATQIADRRVRQFLLTNLRKREGSGYEWRMNLHGLKSNLRELTKAVESTTTCLVKPLFIRGGLSPYIDRSDVAHIRRIFPLAQFHTIPQAGHWVHADAPDEFVNLVREFLG